MKAIFHIYEDHLETFHNFCDMVRIFYLQFEPNRLNEFAVVTKEIDEEITAAKDQMKDVAVDYQHDELVHISNKINRDNRHSNLDNPIDPKA